jgi:hypothetical protein
MNAQVFAAGIDADKEIVWVFFCQAAHKASIAGAEIN